MKKLFLTLLFIGLCAVAAFSQTEADLANQRLVKTLDALEKAEGVIQSQTGEIEALKKLVETLEKSERTPCTIAMNQVKNDLTYWTNQLGDGKSSDRSWLQKLFGLKKNQRTAKENMIVKILEDVRKAGRKSIASQCGFSTQSDFMKFLDIASRLTPLLILLK